jgi:hypothetical protein
LAGLLIKESPAKKKFKGVRREKKRIQGPRDHGSSDEYTRPAARHRYGRQFYADDTVQHLGADAAEDPDGFRSDVRKALLDLTDDYKLPGISPETAQEARDTAKQIINGILANAKPIKAQ